MDENKPRRKRRKNYINNEDFHNALSEWKEQLKDDPNTRMPEYIGLCFMKIAEGRAKHPWYSGWTFKDEMISEAILTCIKYSYNYDHEKFSNPFAYFTTYVNNAFEQIKQKEKKIADYKFDMVNMSQTNTDSYNYKNFFNEEDY